MQCPTCGTNNAPRALHCEKCGATLGDAEPGFRDGELAAAGAPAASRGRFQRGRRDGEPAWLNGALVIGTAVFAAIALIGIWWNLRAPYVDPVPKPPGGLAVTPFNSGNSLPAPAGASATSAAAPAPPVDEASAALARAQALAAADASAAGAASEAASEAVSEAVSASSAPLTASAATAALTARATAMPPASPAPTTPAGSDAPDAMMQMLSRRNALDAGNVARPGANADLPAHYDNEDFGPAAPASTQHAAAAPAASRPGAASAIAAALAQCERYRWYEVIPKQRCIWAVCNGHWGKDGCPAGANPGDTH